MLIAELNIVFIYYNIDNSYNIDYSNLYKSLQLCMWKNNSIPTIMNIYIYIYIYQL